MGGASVERDISLLTGKGVMQALRTLDYPSTRVDYGDAFADELRRLRPAAVFNALHGGAGEDGTVQAVLEWLGYGYQGAGVRASAIAMDKWATKAIALSLDLPVARGMRLSKDAAADLATAQRFGLPCVVKPRSEGSAVGVSIVRDIGQWPDAVAEASVGGGEILIEEYIAGREFTVAIFDGAPLPVVEIIPRDAFYSYTAKYAPGGSKHVVPAELPGDIARRMQNAALALHGALGVRDYSRVDILMDATGRLAVLECNTLPGLTATSLFPDAAQAAGIAYETVVERLVLCALSRSRV
jgi:D-alanine-D-alanine ligase